MLVEIYNSSDTKLGTIDTVTSWNSTAKLDRAGTFTFTMPASDTKYSGLVAAKRIAKCYKIVGGSRQLVGAGVIDATDITIKTGDRGAEVTVSGDDLLRELTNTSVGFLEIESGGSGVTSAPSEIVAEAQAGWTLDSVTGYTTTSSDVYASFAGESVLEAFVKVAEKIGEHFRLGTGRKVVWLRTDQTDTEIKAIQGISPESSNDAACLITDLGISEQTYDLVTRVYPYGAGNGDARVTLETTTESAPAGYTLSKTSNYLQKTSAHTAYGLIERYVSFKDIAPISNTDSDVQAASDILFLAAKTYLDNNSQIQKTYKLGIAGLEKLVYPGQTMRVVYRGIVDENQYIDLDDDLVILETQIEISELGTRTVGLTVSTTAQWIKSDTEIISDNVGESRIFESHPQLSASIDTVGYSMAMDDNKDAVFRFWLGSEITNLNQVLVRFRIDSLRSTVKTVAGSSTTTASGGGATSGSGGSSTPTSSSGGGQTTSSGGGQTTSSGGGQTTSSGGATTSSSGGAINDNTTNESSHTHAIDNKGTAIAYNLGVDTNGNLTCPDFGAGDPGVTVGGTSHTHNLSVSAHTHTVGNHTHSVNDHTHSVNDHTHSVNDHTHTVTIAAHTHSTPDHTHDLTPNITTTYGIYEESSGNTLVEANLAISVNGGSDLSGDISDIGNGWYSLDITDEVQNTSTLRPTSENNYITFETATAKTAQITAQISVRSVIQAIANI